MDAVFIGTLVLLSIFNSALSSPALLLSPYLNNTEEARRLSAVNPSLFLNKTSYAGYLTIDPLLNSNTFFWYFPVEGKPVNTTPWIIWLQGGPGVSSLAGLFDENGPFEYSGGELKARKYAWSNNHSMLYIDNPVGVGYSFTDSPEGFAHNITMYSSHLYSALQQFLTIFPDLRKAPLFIAGESYAGRFVPGLASNILEMGTLPQGWEINLEGLIMGNPVLDREDEANITDAFYQWGLIDSQRVMEVKPIQESYIQAVKNGSNDRAYDLHNTLLDMLMNASRQQQIYNPLVDTYNLTDFVEYLEKENVREALHVGQIPFSFRNTTVQTNLKPDFLSQVQPRMEKLLDHYKVLIYCGQLDLTAPCAPNAKARRDKWHWNKRDEFLEAPRVTWWYDKTLAGYVKSGGGLTEALIRGSGHLAPIDKPAQVLQLVSSFIWDTIQEMPQQPNPLEDDKNEKTITTVPTTASPVVTNSSPVVTTVSSATTASSVITTASSIVTTKPPPISTKPPPTTKQPPANATVPPVKPISSTQKPSGGPVQNNTTTNESTSAARVANDDKMSGGTIASIVINVLLISIAAVGVFIFYKQRRRRSRDYFYNNVDNSDELFLT